MAVDKENYKLANSLMSYDISIKCITALAMGDHSEYTPSFNTKDIINDDPRNLTLNKTIKKEKEEHLFSQTVVKTQKNTILSEGGEFNHISEQKIRNFNRKSFNILDFEGGDENQTTEEEVDDKWESDDTDGEQS